MKNGARLSSCLGVFLVSLAALSLEVALSRLFSVALWHHFAFMVVSLALLGYGASGSFLTLFPSLLQKQQAPFFVCSAALFSITCVGSYVAANRIPFDPFRMSWDRLQLVYLFADYVLLSVPFFFAGLCLSGALTHFAGEAGKIYFSDLAGAGAGSLFVLTVFLPFGDRGVVVLPAMVGALGALAFALQRPVRRGAVGLSVALFGFLGVLFWVQPSFLAVRMSPYKSLRMALWYPDSKILKTRWNAFSRVDVVRSPLVRFAPGLSLTFLQPLPPQLGITIDGDHMTAITRYDGRKDPVAFLAHLPDALPYRVASSERVLVIEPGGGLGVLMAVVSGAERIDAVFENPLVHWAVTQDHGAFGGDIFRDPRVTTVTMSGRSYLQGTKTLYDIIQYSPLSSLGASSTGLRGLQESYMLTIEAVEDLLNHLKPDGILSVTQYLLPPPRQEIRLVHIALEAMARMEISNPESRLAAIRTWGTFTLLLKRTPFRGDDIEKIQDFCREMRFDTVYFPGITRNEANRYNRFADPIYFEMVEDLLGEASRRRLIQGYLFDLTPVTDDKPFFFNFFRIEKIVPLYRLMHKKWQPFVEGGYLVPVVLVASLIASGILIALPLLFKGKGPPGPRLPYRFWMLAFFGLLGWGYMFVEVVLIQKLILFLDRPTYAMTTVIFGLLVSSGFGSLISQKVAESKLRITLAVVLFVVGLLLAGYLRILSSTVGRFLGLELGYREALVLVLLSPLGFVMGIPFPLGIRFLNRVDPKTIPWAWCANGCFSVMGAVLSMVLAMRLGFSGVMSAAAGVYLGACGVVLVAFLNCTDHRNKSNVQQVGHS